MEQSISHWEAADSLTMENERKQTCDAKTEVVLSAKKEKGNALIDFTERTTFHGIRYIVEEGCILRR